MRLLQWKSRFLQGSLKAWARAAVFLQFVKTIQQNIWKALIKNDRKIMRNKTLIDLKKYTA